MPQKLKAYVILGAAPGETEWGIVDDVEVLDEPHLKDTDVKTVLWWNKSDAETHVEFLHGVMPEGTKLKIATLWGELTPPRT